MKKKELIILAINIGSPGTIMQLKGFINTSINLNSFYSIKVIVKKKTYNLIREDMKFLHENHNVKFYQTTQFFLYFFKFYPFNTKKVIFVPGGIGFYPSSSNLLMVQSNLPFEESNWKRFSLLFRLKLKIAKYLTAFSIIFAKKLVFNTEFSKSVVKLSLPKLLHKKIHDATIIPLGLSSSWLEQVKKKALTKPFDIFSIEDKKEIVIVYPSSFDFYKHHEFVIDTAIEFSKIYNKKIILRFIGGGDSSRILELQKYLFSSSIKTVNLQIFKDIRHNDILDLFLDSDIGIFMSSCESFGYSLLELVSSGLPVICNNYPAYKEFFGNEIHYSDLSDSKKTASSIQNIITNPKKSLIKACKSQKISFSLTSKKSDTNLIKELRNLF